MHVSEWMWFTNCRRNDLPSLSSRFGYQGKKLTLEFHPKLHYLITHSYVGQMSFEILNKTCKAQINLTSRCENRSLYFKWFLEEKASQIDWPIWIANGNYMVIPGPCFSPSRWRWINQNDDSQADEREEDNLYTSYEGLSSQQCIPAPPGGSQMDSQSKPWRNVVN